MPKCVMSLYIFDILKLKYTGCPFLFCICYFLLKTKKMGLKGVSPKQSIIIKGNLPIWTQNPSFYSITEYVSCTFLNTKTGLLE